LLTFMHLVRALPPPVLRVVWSILNSFLGGDQTELVLPKFSHAEFCYKGGKIMPQANFLYASNAIGNRVKNQAGENLGKIEDLVIDSGTAFTAPPSGREPTRVMRIIQRSVVSMPNQR